MTTPTVPEPPPHPPKCSPVSAGVSLSRTDSVEKEILLSESEQSFICLLLSGRVGLPDLDSDNVLWHELLGLGIGCGLGEDGVRLLSWYFWSHRGDSGDCPFCISDRLRIGRNSLVRRFRDWGYRHGFCDSRIADAEEVLERYTEVMRDGSEKSTIRLEAMKALGSKHGLFRDESAKSQGRGGVTIVIANPYASEGGSVKVSCDEQC